MYACGVVEYLLVPVVWGVVGNTLLCFGSLIRYQICCSLQVVVCSFVYGGSKPKPKQLALAGAIGNEGSEVQRSDKLATPTSAPSSQNYNPSGINVWHGSRQAELRNNPHTGIDLTRG